MIVPAIRITGKGLIRPAPRRRSTGARRRRDHAPVLLAGLSVPVARLVDGADLEAVLAEGELAVDLRRRCTRPRRLRRACTRSSRPASDENEKLAKPEVVEAGGPEPMVVSGAVVSTVQL